MEDKKTRLQALAVPTRSRENKTSSVLISPSSEMRKADNYINTDNDINDYYLCNIKSDQKGTTKFLDVKPKLARLQGLAASPSRRPTSKRTNDLYRPLADGWFFTGIERKRTYYVEELYKWYYIQCQILRKETYPIAFDPYRRQAVLAWLKADGWRLCEEVIQYGVRNWEPIKIRFGIDSEHPFFFILYGYRQAIKKEMGRTNEKTWGADYPVDQMEDNYGEARVELLSW